MFLCSECKGVIYVVQFHTYASFYDDENLEIPHHCSSEE